MVRMNVLDREKEKKADQTWPIALALLGFIVAGIFLTGPRDTSSMVGVVGVEEKEILFLAIERVESSNPEMKKWGAALRSAIEKDLVPIPQFFFESDPIAQESEVVQWMAKQIVPLPEPEELALKGD